VISHKIMGGEHIPFSEMSIAELEIACYGEGCPPGSVISHGTYSIVVYMDEEKIEMPFGLIETEPFLELFWRKTGADCDGEEEEMEFPDGTKYRIALVESRG
jgi:hypothetical protein